MEFEDIDKLLSLSTPSFSSVQEELEYWKGRALGLRRNYVELNRNFDEFQEDSKILEHELDTQLKMLEHKNKDLTSQVARLQNDNEHLRSRVDQMTAEHNAQSAEWSSDLESFRKTGEELNLYVRELEQKNDDLERTNRAAAMSIEDFEVKLHQAIERNVYLESELDEKDNLKAMVQRLKDETRDLRYELQVTKKGGHSHHGQGDHLPVDSNRLECTPPPPAPFSLVKQHQANLGSPTSTSRMSPLSIVNDLLRKVGALENKLTTYPRKEERLRNGTNKLSSDSKNLQNKAGTGGKSLQNSHRKSTSSSQQRREPLKIDSS